MQRSYADRVAPVEGAVKAFKFLGFEILAKRENYFCEIGDIAFVDARWDRYVTRESVEEADKVFGELIPLEQREKLGYQRFGIKIPSGRTGDRFCFELIYSVFNNAVYIDHGQEAIGTIKFIYDGFKMKAELRPQCIQSFVFAIRTDDVYQDSRQLAENCNVLISRYLKSVNYSNGRV